MADRATGASTVAKVEAKTDDPLRNAGGLLWTFGVIQSRGYEKRRLCIVQIVRCTTLSHTHTPLSGAAAAGSCVPGGGGWTRSAADSAKDPSSSVVVTVLMRSSSATSAGDLSVTLAGSSVLMGASWAGAVTSTAGCCCCSVSPCASAGPVMSVSSCSLRLDGCGSEGCVGGAVDAGIEGGGWKVLG